MVPAMRAHMKRSDMRRLERDTMRTTTIAQFSLALPWLLSAGDQRERALLWAFIPWPAKLLYRFSWRARFEKLRSPFMGADTPDHARAPAPGAPLP